MAANAANSGQLPDQLKNLLNVDVQQVVAGLTAEAQKRIAEALPGEAGRIVSAVIADRDRLHQVVANLLNNAMKFTRPGGTIVLCGTSVGEEVHISVTDTGIGVALEDQERIFEKFQQVGDTLTDKPRGTGLGLPICRDIVEHHRGRMWVDSEPGAGSKFTVALPAESDALARAA